MALPAVRSAATAAGGRPAGAGLRRALIAAALASLVIVGAGTRLPYVGVALGEAMGWSVRAAPADAVPLGRLTPAPAGAAALGDTDRFT